MVGARWLLVTGFGPYEEVVHNPTRELALALAGAPPEGVRVIGRELPVSFEAAPRELRRILDELGGAPEALLGLGMQRKSWFRLERCARGRFDTARFDNDGQSPARAPIELGPTLRSPLDMERLAAALRAAGAGDVRISEEAGGYVCERLYYELLSVASALGVPGLFLHVPPSRVRSSEEQLPLVRALAAELVSQARAGAARPA